MKAIKIKDDIYWVGSIDWGVRNFHGYLTQKGTTYNAYLVIDEKITLIDTVKAPLSEEMINRISDVIDPAKIDYLVCNHVEMDHSGAMDKIMERAPNARIVTSPNGQKGLEAHYKKNWNYHIVKSGDSLSMGKRSLQFVLTPMVHWPDNMVGYMPEEKILFSNDSFGQHLASSERFDDEYPLDIIMLEARKYFANIVLPYSGQVRKELEAAAPLDIEMIATSHGIIWKKHVPEIIEQYKKWSSNTTDKKAIIVYDTMWKSTEKMAYAVMDAFEAKGYNTYLFNLQHNHISDIMTDLIDAEYICVGSPTLNGNIMPSVAGFLTYMQGLSPKKRKSFIFSSYGWATQASKQMTDYIERSGFEVVGDYRQKYIPGAEDLEAIKKDIMEKLG